jgi:hypothetical protein
LKVEGTHVRDHDVFISYSHKDRAVADLLCATMEQRKIHCWMAPRDIAPGSDWSSSIISAIEQARVMVLVFSSNSNLSNQVLREVERAVSKGLHVVPLRIEDVSLSKSLEYFLSSCHWLDAMSAPMDEHLRRLAAQVRLILADDASVQRMAGDLEATVVTNPAATVTTTAVAAPVTAAQMSAPSRPRWTSRIIISAAALALVCVLGWAARRLIDTHSTAAPSNGQPVPMAVTTLPSQVAPVASLASRPTDAATPEHLPEPMVLWGSIHLEGDQLAITPRNRKVYGSYIFGDPNWSNYDLEFEAIANTLNSFRIDFHWVNGGNYCDFDPMNYDDTFPDLNVKVSGQWQRKSGFYARLEPDRWYKYRVEVRGSDFHCLEDGKPVADGFDARFTHGRVALASMDPRTRFRNIRVTAPDGTKIYEGLPDPQSLPSSERDDPALVPVPPMKIVDLLKSVDLGRDTLAGHWTTGDGTLTSVSGSDAGIQFSYAPHGEYNFRVAFIRNEGTGPISLIGHAKGHGFSWQIGGNSNTVAGIAMVNGKPYDQNMTTQRVPRWIVNGKPHLVVISARKDGIRTYLDGRQTNYLNADQFDNLDLDPAIKQPDGNTLGLLIGGDAVTIRSADVIEITGRDIWPQ